MAVPEAPTVTFDDVTATSVTVVVHDGNNGGANLTLRRIFYSDKATGPSDSYQSTTSDRINFHNLRRGSSFYFWAANQNINGWSDEGPRRLIALPTPPDRPDPVVLTNITQTTVHVTFTTNGTGGSPITQWQIGYGTNSTAPQFIRSGRTLTITGLNPGVKYYFWARVENEYGMSPWSGIKSITMIAGARVKVGNVWKSAIPYVRVNGVWKVARPWSKIAGVWKENI